MEAIILTSAAIAITNVFRARISANESAAVGALRTINTTSVQYSSTYGVGFPPGLANMAPATPATCAAADLLDNILSAVPTQKSGYSFVYAGFNAAIVPPGTACAAGWNAFATTAVPITIGTTGQRGFCIDHTGVLRQNNTGAPIAVTAAGCDNTAQVVQ